MDPESAWIEELLKSNHAPSNEAAQEARRLLLEPMKDLEDLDAEIVDLKKRLSELESKRNETHKRIYRYEKILAPIRRVPPDVLGEIFYHCLPTHRNPIMASSDCPLLLTRVCSPWRAIAISLPHLWDRLYITFTDDDTVPDLESATKMVRNGQITDSVWQNAQPKSEKQRTTEVLRKRCEGVKEWFQRSGTRPLSISMYFTITPWYGVPYSNRPPNISIEFLSFLATLAPRWKEFEVKTSMMAYRALENMLEVSEMTALTSFRAEYYPHFMDPDVASLTRPLTLLRAPNLRQISLFGTDPRVLGIADRSFTQWNKLTNISYFNSLSIAQTTFLLEHSSNLIHYKGVITEYTIRNTPTVYEGCIFLPFLRSFSITEYLNPQRLLGNINIYDRIDAPKLQWVTYSSRVYLDEFSSDNPAPIPILPLVRKSTELQKLFVDALDLTVWDVGILLRAVPSVTDLVIGQERVFPIGNPMRSSAHMNYDTSGVLNRELWSFDDLIVRNSSEDLENDPPLLPLLKSLTILRPTAQITDDTLFNLIKSRLVPGRTAALENVKARFSRARERDIAEELASYAEFVGVKINLDFEYAPPPLSAVNLTSPVFGLSQKDGRSWIYVDAGETE